MRERTVENYMGRQVTMRGGLSLKWASPGNRGVPDRIIIMPGPTVAFAEVKAPGKTATKLQQVIHKILRGFGLKVFVVDSKDAVHLMLDELRDRV